MRAFAQFLLRSCSVALLGLVNAAAVAMTAPGEARPMLLFCGILAVAAALQSMVWEAEGLGAAMLLSLPPLLALGGGPEAWLIGPLARRRRWRRSLTSFAAGPRATETDA